MKCRLIGTLTVLGWALLWATQPSLCRPEFAPGQILVKFKPGTPASAVAATHRQNRARVLDQIPQLGVQKITTLRGRELAQVRKYTANPNVEFAEPDFLAYPAEVIPNDPAFANWQWGLRSMEAPAAWEISTGSESVMIALVDTGTDYTHPDLAGRIVPGYDFYSSDSDPMDENGHGTHLAGVIGAVTNNNLGVAGVTWRNPVLAVKICGGTGYTTSSLLARGITYAADRGARAINLSWAGTSPSITVKSAVDYARSRGAIVVAASGNNGTLGICYPAAFANVLAVGASDDWDNRSSISNYGPGLDVLAPNAAMSTSLWVEYGTMGGTSVSTAYASGLCGLIFSVNPELSPSQVMQVVRETADDIPPAGWDEYSGWGRINAYRALVRASETSVPDGPDTPPDTSPPSVDLVAPTDGAILSGTVSLSASAADDTGVARVEFRADGELIATAEQPPYSASWDTSRVQNGAKSLSARAFDAVGNNSTSAAISVTVDNPIANSYTFRGSLRGKKLTAYHSVRLSVPAAISASLSWSKGDLDLYLLDEAGRVLASSATSSQPETISTGMLQAGTYTFQVVSVSRNSRYTLNVTCASP